MNREMELYVIGFLIFVGVMTLLIRLLIRMML
jgi:hypothetical protein